LKYGSPKLFILPVPIEQIEQLVWHGYGSMSDHLQEVGQLGQLEARPKSSRFSGFGITLRDRPNQE
jgi:hypothetical protein